MPALTSKPILPSQLPSLRSPLTGNFQPRYNPTPISRQLPPRPVVHPIAQPAPQPVQRPPFADGHVGPGTVVPQPVPQPTVVPQTPINVGGQVSGPLTGNFQPWLQGQTTPGANLGLNPNPDAQLNVQGPGSYPGPTQPGVGPLTGNFQPWLQDQGQDQSMAIPYYNSNDQYGINALAMPVASLGAGPMAGGSGTTKMPLQMTGISA